MLRCEAGGRNKIECLKKLQHRVELFSFPRLALEIIWRMEGLMGGGTGEINRCAGPAGGQQLEMEPLCLSSRLLQQRRILRFILIGSPTIL